MVRSLLASTVAPSAVVSTRPPKTHLLTCDNPKTAKGQASGYLTAILHLAPATLSGTNLCARHTPECFANCLYFAGRGRFPKVQNARMVRTKIWLEHRANFRSVLLKEIDKLDSWCHQHYMQLAVRLNGTSDIRWENYEIIEHRPAITFYDYTKISNRRNLPPNYHLTFSFSGDNIPDCVQALGNGMSVAVPFLGTRPDTWLGYPVVDGDADDLRFLGNGPQIIALRAKGPLRKNPASPFLGDNWNV